MPRRLIFMTRAPKLARCWQHSERPRQAEYMLGDIGQDQVRRDRGNLIQSGLTELALNVVVSGQAVAAIGLNCDVGGLPRGIGSQQLGHVGFGPTWLTSIKEFGRPQAHEIGRFHMDVRLGDRELDALVLADGTTKDAALLAPLSCSLNEPAPIADAFGSDQDALGVHAVQDVAEALPLCTNQILNRDRNLVEVQFVGIVIHYYPDGLHRNSVPDCLTQINEEDREPLGLLLDLLEWRRPGQKNHQVGVLDARNKDLPPVDDVAVALSDRRRRNAGRVGASL